MSKGLTKKEKELLKEFKKELANELPGQVLDLKLFGSKARGDATKYSDVDVMVVLKNASETNKDIVYDIVVNLGLKYDTYNLSLVIYGKKEFDLYAKIPILFLKLLMKEALPI